MGLNGGFTTIYLTERGIVGRLIKRCGEESKPVTGISLSG